MDVSINYRFKIIARPQRAGCIIPGRDNEKKKANRPADKL
jgi:hypothetical protein